MTTQPRARLPGQLHSWVSPSLRSAQHLCAGWLQPWMIAARRPRASRCQSRTRVPACQTADEVVGSLRRYALLMLRPCLRPWTHARAVPQLRADPLPSPFTNVLNSRSLDGLTYVDPDLLWIALSMAPCNARASSFMFSGIVRHDSDAFETLWNFSPLIFHAESSMASTALCFNAGENLRADSSEKRPLPAMVTVSSANIARTLLALHLLLWLEPKWPLPATSKAPQALAASLLLC